MRILFEVVRWMLVVGFVTGGILSFKGIIGSLEDSNASGAALRYAGSWIMFMTCFGLAIVTIMVTP